MAFIEPLRSSSALAVTITREIHISSEKHERNNSLVDKIVPSSLQSEKQKLKSWKANPHPDNIVLPRKPPARKKPAKNKNDLDPVDLTRRLEAHLQETKRKENGRPAKEPLREMDWEKLRRQQRNGHSRVVSRMDARKDIRPLSREKDMRNMYPDGAALSRTQTEAIELYATEMYEAYRQFSPRTESAATGSYQHHYFRESGQRKGSDATGIGCYTASITSSENSRTGSRGSGFGERIKSFLGLPPLHFQVQGVEGPETQTTLSLESEFDKLDTILTNSSVSVHSKGSEKVPADGVESKKTLSTGTTGSGETMPIFLRQSIPQQRPMTALSQQNIHPAFRTPEPLVDIKPQEPVPILALHEASSEQPPLSREIVSERGRGLQVNPHALRRSVSSDDTYKPVQQEVSYSYWRLSRPESWGPGDDESRSQADDHIDSYYFMDKDARAATVVERPPNAASAQYHSTAQQPGAIKRVFGPMFAKNNSKGPSPAASAPPVTINEKHYNLPGMLPDDFPIQRKNFLSLFRR